MIKAFFKIQNLTKIENLGTIQKTIQQTAGKLVQQVEGTLGAPMKGPREPEQELAQM